mmetsp:Transcript_93453/g.183259  ORF Transcript_93453/g.183259 Transcript_93453/m.183259 type:complete len:211 (-) Transcript_93453:127-759(-)
MDRVKNDHAKIPERSLLELHRNFLVQWLTPVIAFEMSSRHDHSVVVHEVEAVGAVHCGLAKPPLYDALLTFKLRINTVDPGVEVGHSELTICINVQTLELVEHLAQLNIVDFGLDSTQCSLGIVDVIACELNIERLGTSHHLFTQGDGLQTVHKVWISLRVIVGILQQLCSLRLHTGVSTITQVLVIRTVSIHAEMELIATRFSTLLCGT